MWAEAHATNCVHSVSQKPLTWLQKPLQSRQELPFDVASPAFPDDEHGPASGLELSTIALIASHIAAAFVLPELGVRGGRDFPITTAMHVPKASMHKDHFSMSRQDQIRSSRQSLLVQSKSKAHLMDQGSHNHLRLRIARTNP